MGLQRSIGAMLILAVLARGALAGPLSVTIRADVERRTVVDGRPGIHLVPAR